MDLKPGTRLGPYEIVSLLGRGGMGEVCRARDPRLGRDVAIKVSAQQFTDRFEREARAIAALNHSSICTLYDVGPNYLVMELVEGPTLAERIAQGPIRVEEALTIAKQIADALEAAHDKGIVHRDLKPANVKIRPDGSVKVLDFGLAKSGAGSEATADSPTMLSVAGMILGTAGYMSPEQARGKNVDKRADIWAFGVVLYEMVTGGALFEGETVSDTLAAVLTREPDWSRVPRKLQRLLRACLEKDPRQRLRDIGDFPRLIEDASGIGNPAEVSNRPHSRGAWIVAGVFAFAAAALAFVHFNHKPPADNAYRFLMAAPTGGSVDTFAISPDGRMVVWAARVSGKRQLWLQAMDSLEPQPIPFTEDAAFPFWSPDGTWVGFFAADKLKKVSLKGGFAQTLCDAPNSRGGTWNAGDVILFSRGGSGTSIRRVAASGGAPADVTKGDPQRDVRHPFFLPDGRRFLYLAEGVSPDSTGIFLSSLDGGDGQRILPDKSSAVFMRSPDAGHPAEILFIRDDTLTAAPFDEKSGQIAGVARPVSEHVGLGIYASWAPLSVSNTGLLAYAAGLRGGTIQLAWFDRTGRVIQTIGPRGGDLNPEPSPDGNMLTYARRSAGSQVTDLWIRDLKRGSEAHLAAQTQAAQGSVWSPRGDEVAFGGEKNGVAGLYRKRASGSGEAELLHAGAGATVLQWSRDGRFVVYAQDDPKTKSDLWLLPMTGAPEDRKPTPLLRTSAGEGQGQLSPDGEWFAFRSNQSGRAEIYVRRFPAGDDQWMISVAGGEQPRWRGDGRELFYISADEKMMAVAIKPAANGKARLEAGVPEALFDALTPHGPAFNYVVSSDGQRFLLADTGSAGAASTPLTVITNFNAERGK